MKAIIGAFLMLAVLAVVGYFGLPMIVQKETSALNTEIQEIKQKLQKAEEFIKIEEEAKKDGQLLPDADAQKIIKTMNSLSSRVTSAESTLGKVTVSLGDSLKQQRTATDEVLKKHSDSLEKLHKETQAKLQKITLDAAMANIRGHIAKARTDLLSKNIATAKSELELIGSIFDKLKTSASDESRKSIEELDAILKKAGSEIDSDLPSAINRVDRLWLEMSKLLRKA